MMYFRLNILFVFGMLMTLSSCKDDDISSNQVEIIFDDTAFDTPDWSIDTHSNDADPDFQEVFSDDEVKRMDIIIRSDRWQTMITDMTSLYGTFGSRGSGGFSDQNPVFVPAEVYYEDKEWYRVGVRFKGNSSLQNTWQNGNGKLSFKLDFDEFEDEYPQIDNQRFYGFKQLSLKNNFDDKSMLREKVCADLFRNAGLASSHTAFYALYVDYGDGPIYFGLYTVVEEVDDTVIDTQFDDNDGNLYKPDGDGASFAVGTFSESDFVKETNEEEADWSDIQNLFTVLHDNNRTSNAAVWRADLESIFDTNQFLKYLAVNTVIQNWDTYGRMTHNYFLYNNPDNNLLTWIPWDNNEALQDGKREGSLALNFSDLTSSQWPLIGYLYADATYRAQYDAFLEEVTGEIFNANDMQTLYTSYAAMIEPYATSEITGFTFLTGTSSFYSAIDGLKSHVTQRASAVSAYLD